MTHKTKRNNGELPRYYIDKAHDPIIRPEDWDIVQEEIAERKKLGRAISSTSFMSCKLVWEDCNSFYGAKVWHSNDQYRRVIYQCNNKYKGDEKCFTPHITEDKIKEMFLKAYNDYMSNRDRVIKDAQLMCDTLSDTGRLESQLAEKKDTLRETEELYRLLVTQNASSTGTADFAKKEKQLYAEYTQLSEEVNELSEKLSEIQNRRMRIENHIQALRDKPLFLSERNNSLWVIMIDHCIIHRDKTVTFVFRDGTEIIE